MIKKALVAIILGLLIGVQGGRAQGGQGVNLPVLAGPTTRVSVHTNGSEGDGASDVNAISDNSDYVAFVSEADNLADNDNNGAADIFVHNRNDGTTEAISINAFGQTGNFDSESPDISGDGRIVAFHSWAFDLIDNDTNNVADVFVFDRDSDTMELVSIHSNGTRANDVSFNPAVSSDGRFVAFWSYADNLVDDDTNGVADVFVRDRATSSTYRVSKNSDGQEADGDSTYPSISTDGRYVVFESVADNLVPTDNGIYKDVFFHDSLTGVTSRLSVRGNGDDGVGDSMEASISNDGNYITFMSFAANLIDGDTNGYPDIFLWDRGAGLMYRVNTSSTGDETNDWTDSAMISGDGATVVYRSSATNLVDNDTNAIGDVFATAWQSGATVRASIDSAGAQANNASQSPSVSEDGHFVAFSSVATNLVANDHNGERDVFVHDVQDPPPPPSVPVLALNFYTARPGSYILVTGTDFEPNLAVAVSANGFVINSGEPFDTDSNGDFQFTLTTTGAQAGFYFLQAATVGSSASTSLWLDPSAPLRAEEGDHLEIALLPFSAYDVLFFSPIAFSDH